MSSYIALIHKESKSDFGVSFPDLPGCVTAGKTLDEARTMAIEALALHLEGLVEDGADIPEPSSLEDIMADPKNRDGVATIIDSPDQIGKAVRVNVTLPDTLLTTIDKFAQDQGRSRSAFLAFAARTLIEAKPHAGVAHRAEQKSATKPSKKTATSRLTASKKAKRSAATRQKARS